MEAFAIRLEAIASRLEARGVIGVSSTSKPRCCAEDQVACPVKLSHTRSAPLDVACLVLAKDELEEVDDLLQAFQRFHVDVEDDESALTGDPLDEDEDDYRVLFQGRDLEVELLG